MSYQYKVGGIYADALEYALKGAQKLLEANKKAEDEKKTKEKKKEDDKKKEGKKEAVDLVKDAAKAVVREESVKEIPVWVWVAIGWLVLKEL